MRHVDQRGIDNPRSAYLSAREAASRLGVKLETLYAYASRGWITSVRGAAGRPRRYLRDDVERMRARHDARAGHGAVAAGALRWGEPVLESSLTDIGPEGPRYRGRPAVALAREGASFEGVADWLWAGESLDTRARWPSPPLAIDPIRVAALLPRGASPLTAASIVVPTLRAHDAGRFATSTSGVVPRARALIAHIAATVALPSEPSRVARALAAPSIAATTLLALGRPASRRNVAAVDRALVVSADHELNVSSFAARVAASAGADLYACIAAALATLSGPKHGGMCDRVDALVDEVVRSGRAHDVVQSRVHRGEEIPGFGHRLYPSGDPRATVLLDLARQLAPRAARVRATLGLIEAARAIEAGHPTVDTGLVALSAALALPRGSALALFGIGRTAGWIAHALEQFGAGFLLRPRARYVGPGPVSA